MWKEVNDALNTFYLRLCGRKEGNVSFNDTLDTFYLRLCGRKLMTHSTHFIYSYVEGRKETCHLTTHSTHLSLQLCGRKKGNVSFNDALNTFYLRLCGRKEMFHLTTHSTHHSLQVMWHQTQIVYVSVGWKPFLGKMIALHQNVANCQNTLTVFTQRWRIQHFEFHW